MRRAETCKSCIPLAHQKKKKGKEKKKKLAGRRPPLLIAYRRRILLACQLSRQRMQCIVLCIASPSVRPVSCPLPCIVIIITASSTCSAAAKVTIDRTDHPPHQHTPG
jgi:hypothetical protein